MPQRWDENPALSFWVRNQRQRNRRQKLRADRVQELDELRFVWNAFDAVWEDGFRQLLRYKQEHGDCIVPRGPLEYRDLANWVHAQRRNRKDGKLNGEQIRRLDEQGFVWELFNASWEGMFSALREYKRLYDDCNVPQGWPKDRRLANWVRVQRTKKADGASRRRPHPSAGEGRFHLGSFGCRVGRNVHGACCLQADARGL